jgi:hypothetical protein
MPQEKSECITELMETVRNLKEELSDLEKTLSEISNVDEIPKAQVKKDVKHDRNSRVS